MAMGSITFHWHDLSELNTVANACAVLWKAPAVVLLEGELGAGKTTLVQHVLSEWGIAGPVKSPTFDLVHVYQMDDTAVFHVDLYRIANPGELLALDLPLPQENTPYVLLVEWGHWVRQWYPERFECQITRTPDGERTMVVTAVGDEPLRRLSQQGVSDS